MIIKMVLLSALLVGGAVSAEESGKASWYGPGHIGKKTANGEVFTGRLRTAAHRTLPLGSVVRVSDGVTGRSVVVRINDRGPYVAGRVIDLSERAARELGIRDKGVANVTLEILALR